MKTYRRKNRSRKENRYCLNCNSLLSRSGYSLCRKCYCKLSNKTKKLCSQCNGKLSVAASATGGICRKCYDLNRSNKSPWQNKEWLSNKYLSEKLSIESIAKLAKCGHTTITKWLYRFNIPIRPAMWQKFNPNLIIGKNNYLFVEMPFHPYARRGKIFEHRYVAECYLGRFLEPEEQVHHIDGDKSNNLPENLYLFSTSGEHTAFHNNPYPIESNLI